MDEYPPDWPLRGPNPVAVPSHESDQCTHSKLVAFQDDFGSVRCWVCRKVPKYGLLYECAAEKDGTTVSQSDFPDLEEDMRKFNIGAQNAIGTQNIRPPVNGVIPPTSRDESQTFINRPVRALIKACDFKVCFPCRSSGRPLVPPKPQIPSGFVFPDPSKPLPPDPVTGERPRYYSLIPRHLISSSNPESVSSYHSDQEEHQDVTQEGHDEDLEEDHEDQDHHEGHEDDEDQESDNAVEPFDYDRIYGNRYTPSIRDEELDCGLYDGVLYSGPSRLFVANASDREDDDEDDAAVQEGEGDPRAAAIMRGYRGSISADSLRPRVSPQFWPREEVSDDEVRREGGNPSRRPRRLSEGEFLID